MSIQARLILIIIVCNLLLTGCNGSYEPDSLAYVIALGFDKANEPGKLKVSFQIAVPRTGTSSEGGGGGGKKNAVVITIEAVTLAEAYNMLNSAIAYTPTLSHTKVVVFGEELAREGLQDIMGPIMRFRQYRGSMHVAVAKGKAVDFFHSNQPVIDITLSKYYETMLMSSFQTGYFLDSSLHTFYSRLKSRSGQAYATLVTAAPTTEKDLPADSKVPGGKAGTYVAGDLPRQGGNKVEFLGAAMFRGDKMVGFLDNDETRMLTMIMGSFKNGYLSVADPLEPKRAVNAFLNLEETPSIKTRIENGVPYIQIQVSLVGELTAIPSGIQYEKEEYLSLLEEQFSNVITERMEKMLRHTQEMGSDVAGLGYHFRPLFWTRPDFNEFTWNDRYREAQIAVEVKTNVRRYGLMIKTSPIEGK